MKIHLSGVGGVAMGNLAAMLKTIGHKVTGSDVPLYPPMSLQLKKWGIPVREYSEKNIVTGAGKARADLYIIGNALSRGNPEVEAILNAGLPYTSMSAALKEFFLKDKQVIVVAGTHGKTTTSFLMDHVLTTAGKAPGLFVGGVRGDGMDGFRVSDSEHFVIEGDEYDTAFFDKHSKFLHYNPRRLIFTSMEFDHADIFRDFKDYKRAFERLLRIIPSRGLVAACKSEKNVRALLEDYKHARLAWYGDKQDALDADIAFTLSGRHNTLNALGVRAAAEDLGISRADFKLALETFPGVKRRQQIRVDIQAAQSEAPVTVVEDFAHHPTAVRETIAAMRKAYRGRAVHALFEPRSATSHRKLFQKTYVGALARADAVYIADIHNPGKVARDESLDVRRLTREIKAAGTPAFFGATPADVLKSFRGKFRPSPKGDVVLVMSNGAFGNIYGELDDFVSGLVRR